MPVRAASSELPEILSATRGQQVMDVNRLPVENGSADRNPRVDRSRSDSGRLESIHRCATSRSIIAVNAPNHRIVRIAQPRRILGDHIQHRLNIRRRAGDDAQDLTRRSLLLQRFLEFLEQPHVLDGDHRLVGEGFEELDLRRGEGAHLGATCDQCSNEFPLLTKGSG